MDELKNLDFGSWFGKAFEGEKILTFDEFLKLIDGWDGILNVELKSGIILYEGLEEKVVDILRAYSRIDNTIISSFNHYSLLTVKKLEPRLKTGVLYTAGLVDPWDYAKRIGADAVHPLFYSLIPPIIEGCKKWNHDERMDSGSAGIYQALAENGVDGIITNVPDKALEITSQL